MRYQHAYNTCLEALRDSDVGSAAAACARVATAMAAPQRRNLREDGFATFEEFDDYVNAIGVVLCARGRAGGPRKPRRVSAGGASRARCGFVAGFARGVAASRRRRRRGRRD